MALPIAVGTGATTFANGEFTAAAGKSVLLSITRTGDGTLSSDARYEIARKTAGGAYVYLFTLTPSNMLDQGMVNGGSTDVTYAARRMDTGAESGLEAY